jgi:hypothetical protein
VSLCPAFGEAKNSQNRVFGRQYGVIRRKAKRYYNGLQAKFVT